MTTVLVFEGQGARVVPGDPPLDLTGLAPAEAQRAIVAHQLDRAAAVADATGFGVRATQAGFGVRATQAGFGVRATQADPGGLAVLGQSLGEVTALVVAGALDRADAFEVVRLRAELPAKVLPARDWTMASLTRVPVAAARDAAEGLELWVVGENGPADVIVVGTSDDFAAYADRLTLTPTTYRELPVVHPYHTPAMEPVAALVGEAVAAMAVRDPVVPVLSPTGPRQVTDAAGVRTVLVDHLVSPVAWSQALTGAARQWPAARWRECGPSASLYRFVWKNRLDLDWAEAPESPILR